MFNLPFQHTIPLSALFLCYLVQHPLVQQVSCKTAVKKDLFFSLLPVNYAVIPDRKRCMSELTVELFLKVLHVGAL